MTRIVITIPMAPLVPSIRPGQTLSLACFLVSEITEEQLDEALDVDRMTLG